MTFVIGDIIYYKYPRFGKAELGIVQSKQCGNTVVMTVCGKNPHICVRSSMYCQKIGSISELQLTL